MPPEVQASQDEMTYTCVSGSSKVRTPEYMGDIVAGWADSLSYSCIDPEPTMTFSFTTDSSAEVDAELSSYAATCSPKLTVPVAVDAGVLVYNLPDIGSLNVSAENMSGILSGSITNWNQLTADNPGYTMTSFPISVVPEADTVALKAVLDFLAQVNESPKGDLLVSGLQNPNIEMYSDLKPGQIAVVPYSYAVTLGLYPAAVFLGLDPETQEPVIAVPGLEGIQSGASQFAISKTSSSIAVKLDPSIKTSAPSGFEPAIPYQAVYPVNYYICNDQTLVPRAVGRFFLRLDQQGSLGGYNYAALAENLRIEAAYLIRRGLPTPTPTPTE
jgi:ABC-type phosphate transport system substrate-binding protein